MTTNRSRLRTALPLALVLAGCAARGPQEASPPSSGAAPADLILAGGTVHTLDPERPTVEALAIRDGRIAALGGEVDALRGPATRVVDLAGRTVVPGLVDHHVHLLNVGLSLLNAREGERLFVDLGGAASPEEVGRRLAARAATVPPGTWILGKGWSQGAWGASDLPTQEALTAAVPDHPVFLTRVDGHASWLNAAALAAAGIAAATPDPPGGRIVRGPDGAPTGVLLETANDLVVPLLPKPADADVRTAFRLAAEALAEQGVVEAHDAGFLPMPGVVGLTADLERMLDLFRQEAATAPLPLRVRLMIPAPTALAERVVAAPAAFRALAPGLGVTHLKLFADGALGSRGGALTHPYADDPTTSGVPRMDAGEIVTWSGRALDAGLDVAVHAIGDEAIRRALDAFERILAARPDLDPARLRIEHLSYPRVEDVARAASLGAILSVQPNFVIPSDEGLTMEDARVGPAGAPRVYAFGTLDRLGAPLAFGSDWFTTPGPALGTFHDAVTRRNAAERPAEGWHPEERLDRATALRILATARLPGGGATAPGLRVGAPADLAILDDDPLTVASDEILGIAVEATLVGGEVVAGEL